MSNVTIYSTPTCSYCVAAKEFFKENNIEYKNLDITTDPKLAEEMTNKTGQMGVPVIIIEKDGKEDVIIGFDKLKIAQLLELSL